MSNSTFKKTVLITGAYSGIGRSTTLLLAKSGHRVYATDRDQRILSSFTASPQIETRILDVRNEKDMELVCTAIQHKEAGLDVLINNAGIYDQFPLMEDPEHRLESILDINVKGAMRLSRLAFPLLLAKKGRIINISSEAALAPLPFQVYGLSKKMLEVYSHVLRQELKFLDLPVILIRPGAHQTGIIDKTREVIDQIDENSRFQAILQLIQKTAHPILDKTHRGPDKVAKVILRAVESSRPRKYYPVGVSARFRILHWLPASWREKLVHNHIRKNL